MEKVNIFFKERREKKSWQGQWYFTFAKSFTGYKVPSHPLFWFLKQVCELGRAAVISLFYLRKLRLRDVKRFSPKVLKLLSDRVIIWTLLWIPGTTLFPSPLVKRLNIRTLLNSFLKYCPLSQRKNGNSLCVNNILKTSKRYNSFFNFPKIPLNISFQGSNKRNKSVISTFNLVVGNS